VSLRDYIAPPLLVNMRVGRIASDKQMKMFDFTIPTDIGLLQIMINFVFYNPYTANVENKMSF